MKRIFNLFLILVFPLIAVSQPNASLKNVKVSGGLTMTAINKTFLPPRVTTDQKNGISSPAEGSLVYDTDLNELQFFSGGWLTVGGGGIGDMLKSIYDINSDDLVDDSDSLNGKEAAFYLARANHTGTQTAATISDFGTEVSNNASVSANTAKVTNATHTGDVTGSVALTITNKAVEIVMLDDGTDGELITWDATGVAATVSTGSAGQVLTSNGIGIAPTFQAGGSDGNGIYDGNGSLGGNTTVTMGGNGLAFSGNQTTFKGLDDLATSDVFLAENSSGTDLVTIQNNGGVLFGTSTQQGTSKLSIEFSGQAITAKVTDATGNFFRGLNSSDVTVHNMFQLADDVIYQITGGPRLGSDFTLMPDLAIGGVGAVESSFIFENRGNTLIRTNLAVTNDAVLNSPEIQFSGKYDSDPGGGTTETDFEVEIDVIMTGAGASPTGRLAFNIEGGEALSIDETQKTTLFGINAASSSFAFLVEDNAGTDLFTVENDGHVGINISNPSQQLHVISNGGINDGAGIRFESAIGDFFEFGGDGATSSGTPTIRSQNTGNNGVGSFHIHEIAIANDVLNAAPEKGLISYQLQRIGGGVVTNARLLSLANVTSTRWMVMPDGSMLFFTASSGFLGTNVPDTEMDFRMAQAHVFGIRNGEIVGNDVTQNSPTIRLSGLYDSDAGGGTTSADFRSEIRTFVTTAGVSPTGRLAFSIEGNEGFSIDQDGVVRISSISNNQTSTTLGAAATTLAVTSTGVTLTGDGGANTLATITGYSEGGLLTLIFTDGNVTITDDNSHASNSVDLGAAFTGADDTTLLLRYDGTSWYELSRSIN